jgi:DNA polymerase-1
MINNKIMDNSHTAPLLLIDGHSLAFRAYYAFSKGKKGPLRTSTGIPTSVCFGFLNSLLQVMEKETPQFLAIAFDTKDATFRKEIDSNYKANRKETPEDFLEDINNLEQLLNTLNFPVIKLSGYEADDILGTLAQLGANHNCSVKLVSGDRDLFQLVDNQKNITVLYLDHKTTGTSEFNEKAVTEKMGVKPTQIVDYKALCGDSSDNIPGVLGIGDKTAVKLITEYQTLEKIYQNIDQIKGAIKKKLEAGEQSAKHSQFLAKIRLDVPLEVTLKDLELKNFKYQEVEQWLDKLELKTLKKPVYKLNQNLSGVSAKKQQETEQLSLFSIPQQEDKNIFSNATKIVTKSEINKIIEPQIIDTEAKLQELVNTLKKQKLTAWDTETTSTKAMEANLVGISCCWGANNNQIAYIPIDHTKGNQLKTEQIRSALKPILENHKYHKVLQNTKYDRLIFWQNNINLTGVIFDTMLASYVLNPDASHNLTDLSERYLSKIRAKSYKELDLKKGQTIADLEIEIAAQYAGLDAYATFLLYEKLVKQLGEDQELNRLFTDIELPLELVLAEMEKLGIKIDSNYFHRLSTQLEQQLKEIEKNTYKNAGEIFNISSPKQLSEILFNKLNLDKRKTRQTKTGYSTDHATLEKLQGDHPIIDYLLEYRTLSKLKSTYVDTLPTLVNPKTGRIHTDFNQGITSTGRLSSSNPNLQNIPIKTEFSRQIRQGFIPSENCLLVSADYSQIELRIVAHLSQEKRLIEAYQNNDDVHTLTAKLLLDKDKISSEDRRLGKIINFGVIYGMGSYKFAKESGIDAKTGKDFISKYRQKYSQLFYYLETLKKQAVSQGFVSTIMGRRRYFNFESESLKKLKGSAIETINLDKLKYSFGDAQLLRAAANAPIQGSSADIIKIAMVKLHQILKNYQTKLLLQVHDELVFEVPLQEWEEIKIIIQKTMENAINLTVPLLVDINFGNNWRETK